MDFPEDLWKIIKAYRFDYVKYWKHILTQTIQSEKVLNLERDIGSPLDPSIDTRGLDVCSIESNPRTVPYGNGQLVLSRFETWNFGWIKFTTDKNKLRWQKRMLRVKEISNY